MRPVFLSKWTYNPPPHGKAKNLELARRALPSPPIRGSTLEKQDSGPSRTPKTEKQRQLQQLKKQIKREKRKKSWRNCCERAIGRKLFVSWASFHSSNSFCSHTHTHTKRERKVRWNNGKNEQKREKKAENQVILQLSQHSAFLSLSLSLCFSVERPEIGNA